MSCLKTVISGSYRKHLDEMMSLKNFLVDQGIEVLSPVGNGGVKNPGEEFIVLDEDPITDERLLQDSVFGKMRNSSFHVLANKGGYLGAAALIEIGYAISLGLEILTLEEVSDPNIKPYTRTIKDVWPEFKGDSHAHT